MKIDAATIDSFAVMLLVLGTIGLGSSTKVLGLAYSVGLLLAGFGIRFKISEIRRKLYEN